MMDTVKITLTLVMGLLLSVVLGAQPAVAGKTAVIKEFVGKVENNNRDGEGDPGRSAIANVAGRFANSANSIAQGPPPGGSHPGACEPAAQNPNQAGCEEDYADSKEQFRATPSRPLPATPEFNSVNGYRTYENLPTCRAEDGVLRRGQQVVYAWEFALEKPVSSDIQVKICLDVRACQTHDDPLGQRTTPGETAMRASGELIAPVVIRAIHEPGDLRIGKPFGNHRIVPDLRMPGLQEVSFPAAGSSPSFGSSKQGTIRDIPYTAEPDQTSSPPYQEMLEESLTFIGKDCTIKWIENDWQFTEDDRVRVEVSVPSSIDVRVRASQDSASLAYIGFVE